MRSLTFLFRLGFLTIVSLGCMCEEAEAAAAATAMRHVPLLFLAALRPLLADFVLVLALLILLVLLPIMPLEARFECE